MNNLYFAASPWLLSHRWNGRFLVAPTSMNCTLMCSLNHITELTMKQKEAGVQSKPPREDILLCRYGQKHHYKK